MSDRTFVYRDCGRVASCYTLHPWIGFDEMLSSVECWRFELFQDCDATDSQSYATYRADHRVSLSAAVTRRRSSPNLGKNWLHGAKTDHWYFALVLLLGNKSCYSTFWTASFETLYSNCSLAIDCWDYMDVSRTVSWLSDLDWYSFDTCAHDDVQSRGINRLSCCLHLLS